MRKTIVTIVTVMFMTGCVALNETQTEQTICTQEDIDNGTCGDPGGGSPQSPLPDTTDQFTRSQIIQAGYTPPAVILKDNCNSRNCYVKISLDSVYWLEVNCYQIQGGEMAGWQTCSSQKCHYTPWNSTQCQGLGGQNFPPS